ncbi:MAG: HDOD domain-containing protein [Deltaproteobacteria bacterium]|nr:HDOD domain-containing protein [Deltaproteobacteria bacterium]
MCDEKTKNIIFVDDENNILMGLKRLFRNMRNEWDMSFANSGEEALKIMSEKHIDVIVTDMRMPIMDGAQLLSIVAKKYPNAVRIVLSGHSDKEAVLRAVGQTHQYLTKPCDPDLLRNTVNRTLELRKLLKDEHLETLVSEMKQLPSIPEIYVELVEELKSDEPSIQFISRLISQDIGMTAKILQIVNSAFFGLRRKVETVNQAVSYLGMENVSSLVLAANVFNQFDNIKDIKGFTLSSLWSHSSKVGRFASEIAKTEGCDKSVIDASLTGGLLHDCGKLVLAANMPEKFKEAIQISLADNKSIIETENEIFNANHMQVGAYLIGVWGLPDSIVEAVGFHHNPGKIDCNGVTPLLTVHAANSIINNFENPSGYNYLDMVFIEENNLTHRLDSWQKLMDNI